MQYQIIWFDFEAGLSLGDTVEASESDRAICGDYGFGTRPRLLSDSSITPRHIPRRMLWNCSRSICVPTFGK